MHRINTYIRKYNCGDRMRADRRDGFKTTAANKTRFDFLYFLRFRDMYLVYLDLNIFESIIMRYLDLSEKKPRNTEYFKHYFASL